MGLSTHGPGEVEGLPDAHIGTEEEDLKIVRNVIGWLLDFIYKAYADKAAQAKVPALLLKYRRAELSLLAAVLAKYMPSTNKDDEIQAYGELAQAMLSRFGSKPLHK